MDSAGKQKLTSYLESVETNGEITAFVMRQIRLENTFRKRNVNAQLWAVNFACAVAIVNLFLLLKQFPVQAVLNVADMIRKYLLPLVDPQTLLSAFFALALLAIGILILNAKKLGGKRS